MSLKKYFIRCGITQDRKGQVFVEYFILLCLLAFLTIVSTSLFYKNIQGKTEDYSNSAIGKMAPYFHGFDDGV